MTPPYSTVHSVAVVWLGFCCLWVAAAFLGLRGVCCVSGVCCGCAVSAVCAVLVVLLVSVVRVVLRVLVVCAVVVVFGVLVVLGMVAWCGQCGAGGASVLGAWCAPPCPGPFWFLSLASWLWLCPSLLLPALVLRAVLSGPSLPVCQGWPFVGSLGPAAALNWCNQSHQISCRGVKQAEL